MKFLVFTVLTVISLNTHAQMRFLAPGDQDYFVSSDGEDRYIYSDENRPLIAAIIEHNRLFREIYEKEFLWKFDEPPTLILASARNQIANGFATVLPRLHEAYFNNGAEMVDEFSVRSWLYVLLSHETAHLYQLNVKRGYSQDLVKIFGRSQLSAMAVMPPFTYVQHPSIFLPTFLLEGNAVFNEGRFGNGGRLYNGAARALFFQLARAGKVNSKRLINDHTEFPYGREKYLVGGFFFLDLAQRHGVEKANSYFFAHADYKFNPFRVDAPFKDNFKTGYDDAIAQMLETWRPLWSAQNVASAPVEFTSVEHAGFTKHENEILVATTTGRQIPRLRQLNLQNGKWSARSVNLPHSKVFRLASGEVAAPGTAPVRADRIESGLFTEGYNFDSRYLNKYYYDIEGPKSVWADTRNSFFAPDLYAGTSLAAGEARHLGYSASSAIIGADGETYYFTQAGKTRTLMRGSKPVFSYAGFYGIPVEANAQDVLFIGPVERGSGLFLWRDGRFFRLHNSDAIVDAIRVDDRRALIAEVSHENYLYKIIPIEARAENPFEYVYFTEKEPQAALLAKIERPTVPAATPPSNEKPYSSTSEWQFDGIDPAFSGGSESPIIGAVAIRYSDPLQNHSLTTLLQGSDYSEYGLGFVYLNSARKMNWDLAAQYRKEVRLDDDDLNSDDQPDVIDRWDTWRAAAGIDYGFFRRPQWRSKLVSHFIYEYEKPHRPSSDLDQNYTLLTQWQTAHRIEPLLAYSPYRSLGFELAHEYVRSAPDWQDPRNIFGGDLNVSYDLFRETYLSARYQAAYSDFAGPAGPIELEEGFGDFLFPTATRILRNTDFPDFNYFEVRKVAAELKQAVNVGGYFKAFPFSLRRLALIGAYNEYYGALNHNESADTLFHEVGGGLEAEILFVHKFPIRIRFMSFESSYDDDDTFIVSAGLNKAF